MEKKKRREEEEEIHIKEGSRGLYQEELGWYHSEVRECFQYAWHILTHNAIGHCQKVIKSRIC